MASIDDSLNKTDEPLYNSRIIKNYIEYVEKYHPNADIDSILSHSGITTYEIEDQGHWFTQHQVDCFHEVLIQKVGNPDISREVGRYAALTKAFSAVRQYILGFISPSTAYWLAQNIGSKLTRATTIKTKKLGSNRIEVLDGNQLVSLLLCAEALVPYTVRTRGTGPPPVH